MKIRIIFLSLLLILSSCAENFDFIDPSEFNNKIAQRTDIESAEELIKIYYNYPANEAVPKLMFDTRKIHNGFEKITLIHDSQEDDSQRAIKIVMIVKVKNKRWTVKEIKTNRKCWEGRGHTNWDTKWCR